MKSRTPAEAAVIYHACQARRLGVENTLTVEEWEAILAVYNGGCAYCGTSGRVTMDHTIPLTRGGGHVAANVVPACKSCNSSKCNRTPEEWREGVRCPRPRRTTGMKYMTAKRLAGMTRRHR